MSCDELIAKFYVLNGVIDECFDSYETLIEGQQVLILISAIIEAAAQQVADVIVKQPEEFNKAFELNALNLSEEFERFLDFFIKWTPPNYRVLN